MTLPTPPPSACRCATCGISFQSLVEMKDHFQTEFHTQNVRLRVEGKAPAPRSHFNDAREAEERPRFACTLCNKTFQSVQTLQSHIKSTAHLMRKEQRILARDSEAASMLTSTSLGSAALGLHRRHKTHHKHKDPAAAAAVGPSVAPELREADATETTCFFCGHRSASVQRSMAHMQVIHNFSIPLPHRCRDLEGLLAYLARKVNGCICFVCGEDSKRFKTLNGLRSHMEQCQHDRLVMSPEYADFYHGELLDPEEPAVSAVEGGELVLADGEKTLLRRRAGGVQKHRQETTEQAEQRRLIANSHVEATALILRQRREALAPQNKAEQKLQLQCARMQTKRQMQLGVRTNKLHPKGYDGEGETN